MIAIATIIAYLIFINLNTSYAAFSAENSIKQQLRRCESHMRIIKEYVEHDGDSKTFYLQSVHHDNQILTGKLNSILTNYCKLLQI